jgi:hypothetical protein
MAFFLGSDGAVGCGGVDGLGSGQRFEPEAEAPLGGDHEGGDEED